MAFNVKVVHAVTPEVLRKVAEVLGIPEAERDQVIHVAVSIRTPAPPPPRRRSARSTTPSATRRGQR